MSFFEYSSGFNPTLFLIESNSNTMIIVITQPSTNTVFEGVVIFNSHEAHNATPALAILSTKLYADVILLLNDELVKLFKYLFIRV